MTSIDDDWPLILTPPSVSSGLPQTSNSASPVTALSASFQYQRLDSRISTPTRALHFNDESSPTVVITSAPDNLATTKSIIIIDDDSSQLSTPTSSFSSRSLMIASQRLPLLHHRNGTIMGRTRKRSSQLSSNSSKEILHPPDGKKHKPSIDSDDKENKATSQTVPIFARSVSTSALEVTAPGDNHHHHHSTIPELFSVHYSLASVHPPSRQHSSAYRSIDARTLVDLFNAYPTAEAFNRRYTLVDCRYDYEYKGGHIRHAVNITNDEQMVDTFFAPSKCPPATIPIFYCEYSQQRGPQMAHKVREMDRRRNVHRYPIVDYAEMYLLDRGYSKFFKEHNFVKYCDPPAYVQMKDKRHADELRQLKKKSKSFNGVANRMVTSRIITTTKSSCSTSLDMSSS